MVETLRLLAYFDFNSRKVNFRVKMDLRTRSKCILVPVDDKENCVRAFDCKYLRDI